MRSLPIAVFVVVAGSTNGASSTSDSDSSSSASLHRLQQQLSPDPGDVLDNLDLYDKLWIEVDKTRGNSCVWSECGIDETDDAYMGDNRDGDEQWYQYRTQSFCANAAYSLYGQKKGEFSFLNLKGGCRRGHFINSFFTYGGADNLLKAIGETPISYYNGNGNDDGNDDGNNGDDGYGTTSNANCVEIDYDDGNEQDDENDDENENSGSGDGNDRRQLSGSNDNDNSYSSSLGCSSDGHYIMAAFKSSSCDGNYFVEATDTFDEYNKQHSNVGCHKIWKSSDDNEGAEGATLLYSLLSNSWTCDIRLYPNSCPDPFGEKGRYDYALQTAARGGNPMWAYKNEVMRRLLRNLAWVLMVLTVCVLFVTYFFANKKRIGALGGRGGMIACLICMRDDIVASWKRALTATILGVRAAIKRSKSKRSEDQRSPSRSPGRNRSRRRSRSRSVRGRGEHVEKVVEMTESTAEEVGQPNGVMA